MEITKPLKVQIIEDSQVDAEIIERKLRTTSLNIELCRHSTLIEGMSAFSQVGPDLIILDLSLPDSAGIQTVIETHKVVGNVPIIVLTGTNDDELGIEALRHGAQDYLIKEQIDTKSLNRSLRYSMERAKAQSALLESEEHFRLAFEEAPVGVVVTENWLIARANRAFYQMTGLPYKKTIGANLLDILHYNGNGNLMLEPQKGNQLQQPILKKREHRYIKRGDQTIWVKVSAQQVNNPYVSNNRVVVIENFSEEKKAEEARALLASIVESTSDAVIGISLDGQIISCNQSACRIYGFEREEIIGFSEQKFIPPESSEDFRSKMETVRKGEVLHYQTQRQTKDSKLIDISLTMSPIISLGGQVSGASTIARDITEHKQMQRNAQNIALMQQRESFMAALTHDLQNPLVGANRILEKLLGGKIGPLTQEQTDLLQGLLDSNQVLLALVQNFLDVYKNEKNFDSVNLTECSLDKLIREVVKVLLPIADGRQIRLAINTTEEMTIQGDALALRRVFQNLLDNALKFTPTGGEILVKIWKESNSVVVEVKNTGELIQEEHLEKLFERFWRAPNVSKYLPGTGLGLYVCKEIVTAHNGSICCTSSVEDGTIFTVRLPQRKEAA